MVAAKEIERDSNQEVVVAWLDKYINHLLGDQYQLKRYKYDYQQLGSADTESKSFKLLQQQYKQLDDIKGIYLWGDPGCGKSFLIE